MRIVGTIERLLAPARGRLSRGAHEVPELTARGVDPDERKHPTLSVGHLPKLLCSSDFLEDWFAAQVCSQRRGARLAADWKPEPQRADRPAPCTDAIEP